MRVIVTLEVETTDKHVGSVAAYVEAALADGANPYGYDARVVAAHGYNDPPQLDLGEIGKQVRDAIRPPEGWQPG